MLLFQDISIVPILALVPLFAARMAEATTPYAGLIKGGTMIGAIAAVILAGRYLLNPLFRVLANTGAREVMTAAALLLVLGTALLMQWAGMSMALGAFLAGVLLAESNYRHELEADIEPFRGLLLGLFFMGVGMSIDGALVLANWPMLAALAVAVVTLKGWLVATLFRLTGTQRERRDPGRRRARPGRRIRLRADPAGGDLRLPHRQQSGLVSTLAATTMLLGPSP